MSLRVSRLAVLLAAMAAFALAQVSNNTSLTGGYYFRHLTVVTDGGSGVADTRTSAGSLNFDGKGGFTFLGQQLVKTAAPVAISGSGTYAVKPGGVTTLTGSLFGAASVNARLGTGALVGASTETGPTIFDLFIAIPISTASLSNSVLNGPYYVSSLEFPGGGTTNIRNTNFKITANGAGGVAESAVTGQARNLGNRLTTQTISPITYLVSPDATGILNFPTGAGLNETSQLILGPKNIFVSQDGNYFIGGSQTAGSHGMMVGIKASVSGATNASWSGFYYSAGLRFDADRSRFASNAAAINATSVGAVFGRRTRQSDGLFDASTVATYALGADGSGPFTSTPGRVNVSANSILFSTSGVDVVDSNSYELSFGVRMPAQSGAGVFIDPQRVLNGASFALGYPVSPGGFVTLFGTGLSTQTTNAKTFPFPATLGNVSATVNGKTAPIYLVSPTQISLVVPYSSTGNTATIIVTSNGVASNTVEVPMAATAPGIFSLTQNGLGDGAVLHANYSVVNADSPALPGEIVQVFLSGMGGVTPSVADGAAAPGTTPFAVVNAPTAVTIGGQNAQIFFNGLTPLLASLYQLNVRIPTNLAPGAQSLAVQTIEGFTDMVSIRVGKP
ncbi:MAG: hypothetical protein ABIR70_17715 [Bryobacteraceae bacterium]